MTQIKPKRTPLKFILIIGGIILITQMSTLVFSPNPEKDAWGKIILPADHTKLEQPIRIVGETQDIASGQFIWLVRHMPGSMSCTPVKRVLRNTRFRTSLSLPDTDAPFDLSIYVVGETLHENWQDAEEKDTGFTTPCPPDERRLDTVRLLP